MLGRILIMACVIGAYILGVASPRVFMGNDEFYKWVIQLLLWLCLFAAQMAREL